MSSGEPSSRRWRASRVEASLRWWRRGRVSTMRPPATVASAERRTKWSPRAAAIGRSSRSWAQVASPGASASPSKQPHASLDLVSADVQGAGRVVREGADGVGDGSEANVDGGGGLEPAGRGEDHAALDVVGGDAAEVDGGAGAGRRDVERFLVRLQAAHAALDSSGFDDDGVADAELAVEQGAGDDGSEAADREGAVDGHSRSAAVGYGRQVIEGGVDQIAQLVDALARHRGDRGDD